MCTRFLKENLRVVDWKAKEYLFLSILGLMGKPCTWA